MCPGLAEASFPFKASDKVFSGNSSDFSALQVSLRGPAAQNQSASADVRNLHNSMCVIAEVLDPDCIGVTYDAL